MKNTIRQLKQFERDALYEKKKHYNAAERKHKCYDIMSVSQIIVSAVSGTTLINAFWGDGSKITENISLCLVVLTTILASLQKFLNLEKQSLGNRTAANMYLKISKHINLTLSLAADNAITEEELKERAEMIMMNIEQANEIGSQFSTSHRDYRKAKMDFSDDGDKFPDGEINTLE